MAPPMPDQNGIIIRSDATVPLGMRRLFKAGRLVWSGPIGAPIEDAVCDEIRMHPHPRGLTGVLFQRNRKLRR